MVRAYCASKSLFKGNRDAAGVLFVDAHTHDCRMTPFFLKQSTKSTRTGNKSRKVHFVITTCSLFGSFGYRFVSFTNASERNSFVKADRDMAELNLKFG